MTATVPVLEDQAPTCRFGICGREAEHAVYYRSDEAAEMRGTLVCGLHVTPATVWGVPEDAPLPVIVPLAVVGPR